MQTHRTLVDWALFAFLSLLWASAYGFTRLAVSQSAPEQGFPPEFVIPARLFIGAVLLLIAAWFSKQSWPPLRDYKSWLAMTIMGISGTTLPFWLITTAQQTVDSSLAALYVAAAPLFVASMAHFLFADDRLTTGKTLGILVGFVGVAVLFGPSVLSSLKSASALAQGLCLFATFFYAVSTITARYARDIPPFIFAAGFVSIGTVLALPLLLYVDFEALSPSPSAIAGLVGLGIAPTALASFLYVALVKRTSATFLSLTGYTIPIISALIGYLAFAEVQSWNAVIAFTLILFGVWLARNSGKSVTEKTAPQSP